MTPKNAESLRILLELAAERPALAEQVLHICPWMTTDTLNSKLRLVMLALGDILAATEEGPLLPVDSTPALPEADSYALNFLANAQLVSVSVAKRLYAAHGEERCTLVTCELAVITNALVAPVLAQVASSAGLLLVSKTLPQPAAWSTQYGQE